jgi:hypothetical protein
MKRTWTIIGTKDVGLSFAWYQTLFGQPRSQPAHDFFGLLRDDDGEVLICLHRWGDHEHPTLLNPEQAKPGNGLILFFRVDNFDETLARCRSLVTTLAKEPETNPATGTREFTLWDPDGYYVMVSALG